jgi:hypothetical protein
MSISVFQRDRVVLPSAASFAFLAVDWCQDSRVYRLHPGSSAFRQVCCPSLSSWPLGGFMPND